MSSRGQFESCGRGGNFGRGGDRGGYGRGGDRGGFSRGGDRGGYGRGGDRGGYGRGGDRGGFSRGGDRGGYGRGGDRGGFSRGGDRGGFSRGGDRGGYGRGGDRGRPYEREDQSTRPRPSSNGLDQKRRRGEKQRDVVVILAKAGLWLGNTGLVDAYERAAAVDMANPSLEDVRPDIVHQCLLALFDSDLGYSGRLRIYLSTIKGKVIEISPRMRPPRTYGRFKGVMEAVLRDGRVQTEGGEWLMRTLKGTVAPLIPHGASVVGLCNNSMASIVGPSKTAQGCIDAPVDDSLQGGEKGVLGFFCIPCNDEVDLSDCDFVTEYRCLSSFPSTAHVLCSRLAEGFARKLELSF